MQLSDPSLWSEIERLTKNLAWEKYFPKAELGDLVQDVYARILDPEYKNKAIPNGVIHYGYVRQCISSVIADHKWEYLKRNDYLKAKAARTSKKQPQTSLSSEEPLSDSYVVDNHYSGDSVSPDVLQGEMDSLRSEQSPLQ